MSRVSLWMGLIGAVLLVVGAAPADAAYTAAPVSGGIQMTGDGASDTLTITVGDTTLSHDRFGVDAGFASAEDFDTTQAGTQSLPSTYATPLAVDGGSGQDTLRVVDGRAGNAASWLHAGSVNSCVQETIGTVGMTVLCYRAATVDAVTLDGGSGDDRISSLDGPPTTLLTLAGGDGNDSLSQDGEDGVHLLDSPVALVGGAGDRDEASFTEDQSGSLDYSIGNGVFQGTGYAPVSYDETAEFLTLYTRLGPDNHVTITEQRPFSINVWSAGGTINSAGAGPQAGVIARSSLFQLDDQGPIKFRGGPADDVFLGTDLNDRAAGGGGSDQLQGEGGTDRLSGGGQADLLDGGDGRDLLKARDHQRDSLDCGAARDKAKTDRKEALVRGCELVSKPR